MRRTIVLFGFLAAIGAAFTQNSTVEMQGNREDIKWNAFQVFINIGGFITACLSPAGLTGVAIPLCAMTTISTFSTLVCLGLKLFDGLITKDDGLAPQFLLFLQSSGIQIEGHNQMVSSNSLKNDPRWSPWAQSATTSHIRQLKPRVKFSKRTYKNSIGYPRTTFCLEFELGDNELEHPLRGYHETICVSTLSLKAFGETSTRKLPAKALSKTVELFQEAGIYEGFERTHAYAQEMYSVFGIYSQEFIEKNLDIVERISAGGEPGQCFEFSLNDEIEGVQEQLIHVQLSKPFEPGIKPAVNLY